MTRSPRVALAARMRSSSSSADASRYSAGSSPCRGLPVGMTSPIEAPGPYPGRVSKVQGPAARSVAHVAAVEAPATMAWKIGSAAWWERVCQYVVLSVGAVYLKKKKKSKNDK